MSKSDFTISKRDIAKIEKMRTEAKSNKNHKLDKKLRALLLIGRDGKARIEAASICECTERSIYVWQEQYREFGLERMPAIPNPGRPKRLDSQSLKRLSDLIIQGPGASGYETGIWTGPLVADLVKREFNVVYSVTQVRRILHELGFSVQYPKKTLTSRSRTPGKMDKRNIALYF